MKISDLSVEGLLITGWLYKKVQEHKNKPPEPPQKHPKGCYIAVLLFFLIKASPIKKKSKTAI